MKLGNIILFYFHINKIEVIAWNIMDWKNFIKIIEITLQN